MGPLQPITAEKLKAEPFMRTLSFDFNQPPGNISLNRLAESFVNHRKREFNRLPFIGIRLLNRFGEVIILAVSLIFALVIGIGQKIYQRNFGIRKHAAGTNAFSNGNFVLFFLIVVAAAKVILTFQKNIPHNNALKVWQLKHREALTALRTWNENIDGADLQGLQKVSELRSFQNNKEAVNRINEIMTAWGIANNNLLAITALQLNDRLAYDAIFRER